MTFRLFEDSDAGKVADLLNKNRFYAGRHKLITAEDYLYIQRSRGILFSVIALKNDEVIGLVGAYYTGNQHVTKPHQIIIGTFIIDNHFRLSSAVVLGIYETLYRELINVGYEEIWSIVVPENTPSIYLTQKNGFVLLNRERTELGRWILYNYSTAFLHFADVEGSEIDVSRFFFNLPLVDKRDAQEGRAKEIIGGRYIECGYKYQGKNSVLLFDIINYRIDGAQLVGNYRIYPDFNNRGKYIAENFGKKQIDFPIHMVMQPECGSEDIFYDVVLEPGQTQIIDCSPDVAELKISFYGVWHRFFPNQMHVSPLPAQPIRHDHGDFSISLDPDSGFLSIIRADDETNLAKILWPCATIPYLEGALVPRIKDLQIEHQDDHFNITEKTDTYEITRLCKVDSNKISISTTLKFFTDDNSDNIAPISHIYAPKGLESYALKFDENEETAFEWSDAKHDGYEFADYAFWEADPQRFDGKAVRGISLARQSSVVDIIPDAECKPVINAPMFTFFLNFDKSNATQEQTIEEMEIHYNS